DVRFADGETGTRVVYVPLVYDAVAEPNKTFTVTLSDPTGCAALGAQTTANVTVRDDDRPVVGPPTRTVGGTVSGLAGTGLALENAINGDHVTPGNGPYTFSMGVLDGFDYDVRVASQPTDPVQTCVVANATGTIAGADVTNVDVTCTTSPVNGALD